MLALTEHIAIPNRLLKAILHDAEKSARAVNLVYVHDSEPGITRVKKGQEFVYILDNRKVKDEALLERIKKLVIPPAWENVWICSQENGHLQATGLDTRGRKQYRYHPLWNSLRNHTKYYRLHEFGKALPAIRQQIERDLSLPGLPVQKVLAAVVSLMEQTSIRVGNNAYEKLYGSFGLTTLKDQHVRISGPEMRFVFKGKKGISHNISIKSKRLANIVKKCRDIPGKELFQYIDEHGSRHCIDSGMVNQYLKTITEQDFTAKDFRTWTGSVHALLAFKTLDPCETATGIKKNIAAAIDQVASHLGNTRTVCKKYYIHPVLISLYEEQRLHAYLGMLDAMEPGPSCGLACSEQLLMTILEKERLTIKMILL